MFPVPFSLLLLSGITQHKTNSETYWSMTTNETPTSCVSDIPEDDPIIPPRQHPTVETTAFRTDTVGTLTIKTLDVEGTAQEQGPLYPGTR